MKVQRLMRLAAGLAAAFVVVTMPSTADAISVASRPFLGGGVVLAPTARKFHTAHLAFTAPAVHCAKGKSSVIRVGIFGVDHFTNSRTGRAWSRRWFSGLVVRCAATRRNQESLHLGHSGVFVDPKDRIEVDDSIQHHCETPYVADSTTHVSLVSPCPARIGGKPRVVREWFGWRHLLGARLSGAPLAAPLVVQVVASASRRPLGMTHHYLRTQRLHHRVAVHVPSFIPDAHRIRVVVR